MAATLGEPQQRRPPRRRRVGLAPAAGPPFARPSPLLAAAALAASVEGGAEGIPFLPQSWRQTDGAFLDGTASSSSCFSSASDGSAKARQLGIFCDVYEVCKCTSAPKEEEARCLPDTCGYAPSAPSSICHKGFFGDDPDCTASGNWEDCEWANFNAESGWDRPGQGLFMNLPKAAAGAARAATEGLVVLTDVDDTIKCSGGPPGGADRVCQGTRRGGMYPGVAEFSLALARGPKDFGSPAKVVPLSARPSELHKFLAMSEDSSEGRAYLHAGESVGIQGWGLDASNAQYGSLMDVSDFTEVIGVKQTDLTRYDKLGWRKYKNWKAIASRIGKPCVFVGDNGQGDLVAAQMMQLRSSALEPSQGAMQAAFIHDVLRRCGSSACREAWAEVGIFLFADYAEAAAVARKQGLISRTSCRAVCEAAPQMGCSCE